MKTSKITIDEFKKINNSLDYDESISKLKEKKRLEQLHAAIINIRHRCNQLQKELTLKKSTFNKFNNIKLQQQIARLVQPIDRQDYYKHMPKRPEPPKFIEFTAKERARLYAVMKRNSGSDKQYINESMYGKWNKSDETFKHELRLHAQDVEKYTWRYNIKRLVSLVGAGYRPADIDDLLMATEIYKKHQELSILNSMILRENSHIQRFEEKIKKTTETVELLDKKIQQANTQLDAISQQINQQSPTEVLDEKNSLINTTTTLEESDCDEQSLVRKELQDPLHQCVPHHSSENNTENLIAVDNYRAPSSSFHARLHDIIRKEEDDDEMANNRGIKRSI